MRCSKHWDGASGGPGEALRDAGLLTAAYFGCLLYLILACLPRPVF